MTSLPLRLPYNGICFKCEKIALFDPIHYSDVTMSTMGAQIIGVSIVCPVCLDTNQGKHQSSASLVFVRRSYRRPMVYPHKGSVTRKKVIHLMTSAWVFSFFVLNIFHVRMYRNHMHQNTLLKSSIGKTKHLNDMISYLAFGRCW